MTTWYDPDEIKAEADGAQRQPEFDPEATADYDDVEEIGDSTVADDLVSYSARMKAIIDTFTQ